MCTRIALRLAAAGVTCALAAGGTAAAAQDPDVAAHRRIAGLDSIAVIPPAIRAEHEELLRELGRMSQMPGAVGRAGRDLAAVLHPHFVREEQIALPPLGLLRTLAERKATPAMAAVLPMTDSLRAELPRMLTEHAAIAVAVERLRLAARDAKAPAAEQFALKLRAHARQEEDVMYPAAVLVGEYLRLRLPTSVGARP